MNLFLFLFLDLDLVLSRIYIRKEVDDHAGLFSPGGGSLLFESTGHIDPAAETENKFGEVLVILWNIPCDYAILQDVQQFLVGNGFRYLQ